MHIKSQDKVMLISAFIVGMAAGAYLYLMGYVPQFTSHDAAPQQELMRQFTLEGESYGGGRAGIPPSFQILADGTYRYIPFALLDATNTINDVRQGALPTGVMQSLRKALVPTDLTLAARPVAKDTCVSMVDGVDYRYTVTVSGAEFKLDTCTTALSSDSQIGQALATVWDYFMTMSASGE
jgi:hypothetical protein